MATINTSATATSARPATTPAADAEDNDTAPPANARSAGSSVRMRPVTTIYTLKKTRQTGV